MGLPEHHSLMTAAPGLREIQAGELAVIFYCSAVVGFCGVDFASEVAKMYCLFFERYAGKPFPVELVPVSSLIFRIHCP